MLGRPQKTARGSDALLPLWAARKDAHCRSGRLPPSVVAGLLAPPKEGSEEIRTSEARTVIGKLQRRRYSLPGPAATDPILDAAGRAEESLTESTASLECVFCRIIAGLAPASFVYRDERAVAFLDHMPVNPGHVLVVPRLHAASLAELPEEHGAGVFRIAQRLAASLRVSGLRCEGVNLLLNDGAIAGQRVFHVHLHVIPRYEGDERRLRRPPDGPTTPPEELDAVAAAIRRANGDR